MTRLRKSPITPSDLLTFPYAFSFTQPFHTAAVVSGEGGADHIPVTSLFSETDSSSTLNDTAA